MWIYFLKLRVWFEVNFFSVSVDAMAEKGTKNPINTTSHIQTRGGLVLCQDSNFYSFVGEIFNFRLKFGCHYECYSMSWNISNATMNWLKMRCHI